jgi:hypothetical protein
MENKYLIAGAVVAFVVILFIVYRDDEKTVTAWPNGKLSDSTMTGSKTTWSITLNNKKVAKSLSLYFKANDNKEMKSIKIGEKEYTPKMTLLKNVTLKTTDTGKFDLDVYTITGDIPKTGTLTWIAAIGRDYTKNFESTNEKEVYSVVYAE